MKSTIDPLVLKEGHTLIFTAIYKREPHTQIQVCNKKKLVAYGYNKLYLS